MRLSDLYVVREAPEQPHSEEVSVPIGQELRARRIAGLAGVRVDELDRNATEVLLVVSGPRERVAQAISAIA